MASKLGIYNEALLVCGERFLASLTEEREPRRLLDHVWGTDGVKHCLERGQWIFAMRTARFDLDTDVTPPFGYQNAFSKPDDWVVTSAICYDEFFNVPITQYADEAGYWYANEREIYVRYVSDDSNYGNNLGAWPESFTNFVGAYFASRIIKKLTSDKDERDKVEKISDDRLRTARSVDAMAKPTQFPPEGKWRAARRGIGTSRRDGGSRNNLIG